MTVFLFFFTGMAEVSLPSWQITKEVSELCYEEGAPRLAPVAENEEECLRAAWQRLGVGKVGFLDRGGLALLCECIGMQKVAEEVRILLKRMLMFPLWRFLCVICMISMKLMYIGLIMCLSACLPACMNDLENCWTDLDEGYRMLWILYIYIYMHFSSFF
jgi:hypothetical protein